MSCIKVGYHTMFLQRKTIFVSVYSHKKQLSLSGRWGTFFFSITCQSLVYVNSAGAFFSSLGQFFFSTHFALKRKPFFYAILNISHTPFSTVHVFQCDSSIPNKKIWLPEILSIFHAGKCLHVPKDRKLKLLTKKRTKFFIPNNKLKL